MLQPGVAIDVPRSPFLLSPQRNPRMISITAPPLSAVFFENERWIFRDCAKLSRNCRVDRRRSSSRLTSAALYENVSAVMNVALETGFPVVLATAEEQGEGL